MSNEPAPPDPAQLRAEIARAAGAMPAPLATPEEVAAVLGIPELTLTNWRTRKEGPDYVPVGRHVRYRWSSVIAWLEGREIKLGAAA